MLRARGARGAPRPAPGRRRSARGSWLPRPSWSATRTTARRARRPATSSPRRPRRRTRRRQGCGPRRRPGCRPDGRVPARARRAPRRAGRPGCGHAPSPRRAAAAARGSAGCRRPRPIASRRRRDRLERLAPVLVVLAPRPLDERGELAVGVRMGPANPLQPRRRVVRSRSSVISPISSSTTHAGSVSIGRRAELVQPQAHGPDGVVGAVGHAHRAAERRPQDPPGAIHVAASPSRAAARRRRPRDPRAPAHARSCAARSLDAPERRQPRPQERPEQVVVAEPARPARRAAPRTGWRRQTVEHAAAVLDARDGRAQLGVEGVEHRRLDEELDEVGRQAGQHLAQQEVTDGAIGAGERVEEVVASDAALQRDRRQLRAGRPSLGELVQPVAARRRSTATSCSSKNSDISAGRTAGRRRAARAARRAAAAGPTTAADPTASRRRTGSRPAARR